MKTLQEVEAKIAELEELSSRLTKENASITSVWHELKNLPLSVIKEISGRNNFGLAFYSGNFLKVQYMSPTLSHAIVLFLSSVPCKNVAYEKVIVDDFEEIFPDNLGCDDKHDDI